MHRKAQAELALILGLFIIAAVVGIYAFSTIVPPTTRPGALSDEQKAVETYVKDAVRRASLQTLTAMYDQGGYVDTTGVDHIDYGGNDITYWQKCADVKVPDVEKNLEAGIESLLKSSIPGRTDIAGKIVTFDKNLMSADAQIFGNRITLSVTMPTVFEGQAMPQPYTIDLRTSLGRISDFAGDFARFQADYRALDTNLLKLIPRSNPRTMAESCWLPTKGVLFQGSLSKTWGELRECMQRLVIHNLAHTHEWQKPTLKNGKIPENLLDESWLFQIVKSDGTWGQYKELEVEFHYGGEDSQLSRSNPELLFGTSPDPVQESGDSFSMIGFSIGPILSYDVKYDVSYPVVVSVWDPLLERSFKFTTFVNIEGSKASDDCSMQAGPPSAHDQHCVFGATEDMSLKVVDHNDVPLSGVEVWYDDCGPWVTFGGDVQAKIPSATGAELWLLDEFSGSEYKVCMDSSELRDKTVRLPIRQSFDVNFYNVNLERSPLRIKSITAADEENITAIFTGPKNPCMNSSVSIAANYDQWGGRLTAATVALYPTVVYGVNVTGAGSVGMDSFVATGREAVLNIYSPYIAGGLTESEMQGMKQLYQDCGIQPVSSQVYGPGGCSP